VTAVPIVGRQANIAPAPVAGSWLGPEGYARAWRQEDIDSIPRAGSTRGTLTGQVPLVANVETSAAVRARL
jgi:hypothetical protein